MLTIGHLYFSALANDSRSFRAAKAAVANGEMRALLVGYWSEGLPTSQLVMPGIEIRRLKTPLADLLPARIERVMRWFFWAGAAKRALVESNPSLLHCHSLAALPAAVAVKKALRVPLIYDARELETERNGWKWLQKAVAKRIESHLIHEADAVFVVSESIAEWYRDTYGLSNVTVIRNVPEKPPYPVTRNRRIREDLQLSDDALLFIYLGAISAGRGWSQIVDAFRSLPSDKHVVFVGDGPAAKDIDAISREVPNVHWHPPVPITEVPQYAAGADVGISLIEDTCLSYRYCLPNKVHEYRIAGLPVIVSDLPELARFIGETESGWTVQQDSASLARLVSSLDRNAIDRRKAGIKAIPLTWDDEKRSYLEILNRLLKTGTPA